MESLSLRSCCNSYHSPYFVFGDFVDIDCNKRGQTSRPIAEAQLQTGSNFEANISKCNRLLGCVHCWYNNVLLELQYSFMVWLHRYITKSSHLRFLLYKNFPYSPSSSYQIQVQHHVRHQGQPSQTNPLNIARYRKTVSSALWVQLTLVVCYLPYCSYCIVSALMTEGLSPSVYRTWGIIAALVYLNSSLNPILYCWKMREVRRAVKDTLSGLCCP